MAIFDYQRNYINKTGKIIIQQILANPSNHFMDIISEVLTCRFQGCAILGS